jgi:hypothetical protein
MSDGSSKDYAFGSKNHWRRTIWNEVLRRTAGAEKSQPILYLAGPEDLDRTVAMSKGVPRNNLIAIDRTSSNIAAARNNGNIAIEADINAVLWSWPDSRPICAVLLDYCGGIYQETYATFHAFARPALSNAVVMINLLRGRDAWHSKNQSELKQVADFSRVYECFHVDEKHRPAQFMVSQAVGQLTRYFELKGVFPDDDLETASARIAAFITAGFKPQFYTYRSGALVFDSAVFEPNQVFNIGREREAATRSVPAVARKISANLAVRTMRTT